MLKNNKKLLAIYKNKIHFIIFMNICKNVNIRYFNKINI